MQNIFDGVVGDRFGSIAWYIETRSSNVVANGFSHMIWRPRCANPRITSLWFSSSTQMKTVSTPSGTTSSLEALLRLSPSQATNWFQFSTCCPSESLPQMYISPIRFRFDAIGSATATTMLFVDCLIALAYAEPREPAPKIRI